MTTARELWFVGPRRVEVCPARVPTPRAGQVPVRALASGVSQGTELLLYRNEGPTPFDPSLQADGSYPCRYGYAWVGEVEPGAPGGVGPEPGRLVFALAPHGSHHAVDVDKLHVLDPSIPHSRAVLAANMETAVTCVWDAEVGLGDEVTVLGAGVVGLLIAWLLGRSGCKVRVVEPSRVRREVAGSLGATSISPAQDLPRGDQDVVVEATGDPAAIDTAIAHARPHATIVIASFYGARQAPVDLGSRFHRNRLTLRASQVSSLPPKRAPRWSCQRRFALVHRLLQEACLDRLITRVEPFERAPAVYAELSESPGDAIQTVFTYQPAR